MASRRTYVLLGVAAASYLLGFVMCVVGYSIPWLQPKASYDSAVVSVGLVTACFKNFKFPQYIDKDQTLLDGCSRVYEPRFDRLKDYVNPVWFESVRHMHFACILILSLNILLVMGYVVTYILTVRQTRKRGRPTTAIIYTKAACSLWFVFVGVVAIILVVEPSVFHFNYERNSNTFYTAPQGGAPLYYSGGFALTVVAALFCISSTVSGMLLFVGVCRKAARVLGENYVERKMGGSIRGGDNGDAGSFAGVRSGSDQPSALTVSYNRREGESKTDVDGSDLIEKLTQRPPADGEPVSRMSVPITYRADPRASNTPSRSAADERADRSSLASSATGGGSQQQRPVPAPRRSVSSRSQEGLHRPPPEDPQQQPLAQNRMGARSSVHELRTSGNQSSATGDDREPTEENRSRNRYSFGSSYRPSAAAAPPTVRPPSVGSSSTPGSRQQPGDRAGAGARRPDDLPLAHGSLPRSSTSGGSHPPSLASTDISLPASTQGDLNPAAGYKPKELAMMRFISERAQAMNGAAVARASMERRSSTGRASEGGQHRRSTSPGGPKSPMGPKSPAAAASSSPQPPTPSSVSSAKKGNSVYVSY